MDELELDEHKDSVLGTTRENVDKLVNMWTCMFDKSTCKSHLQRLKEHVSTFYEDLCKESLEKKESMENEIRDLHDEAANLQRLLQTETQLPEFTADTPLVVVQMEVDKSIVHLREELRKRHDVICELLLQQEALCEELGETPRPLLLDPLPSAEEIDEFGMHLEALRAERATRLDKVLSLRSNIKELMKVLQLTLITDSDNRLLNQRYPSLTNDSLKELICIHENYEKQFKELSERIDSMRDKLEILWERLQESDKEHMKSIRNHTENNLSTHDVLYKEVQRCEELRRRNLKIYVENLRTEIVEWWDKTLTSEEDRKHFLYFFSDLYTEDLLYLHEVMLEDLKNHYNRNREIFELFADRNVLWDRMSALEAKANEPGRYNNRGGQLLKEERERKTIATKLPKIEQQITELVKEYEQREQTTFKVHGSDILELMANDWERKRQAKEQLSSARKQGQTPQTSSKKLPPPRTPLSLKNKSAMSSSTMSLRKTPSTTQLVNAVATTSNLNKRKLNPKEKVTPTAKRTLFQALTSPGAGFLKPPTKYASHKNTSGGSSSKVFKSPHKKLRVISTTIHRKSISGRRSTGATSKRRLLNKSNNQQNQPEIVIHAAISSDEYTDSNDIASNDETYESFQKRIEPAARSSVLPVNNGGARMRMRFKHNNNNGVSSATAASSKRVRSNKLVSSPSLDAEMNMHIERLPKPRIIRTPSTQQLATGSNISIAPSSTNGGYPRTPGGSGSAIGNASHTPTQSGISTRKLATKNLPIMI